MTPISRKITAYGAALLVSLTLCAGSMSSCIRKVDRSSIGSEMRHVQSASYNLYSYAWDSDTFLAPQNEREIKALLAQLGAGFHRLDEHALSGEPGFRAALRAQQQLLEEISVDFEHGEKLYANQKLRALAGNCIACHSRLRIQGNYFGFPPPVASGSLENRYSAAQYLFATRQFPSAKKELLKLVEDLGEHPWASEIAMRALKLWLVIEVRARTEPRKAAGTLREIADEVSFSPEHQELIAVWLTALDELAAKKRPAQPLLTEAVALLGSDLQSRTFDQDEKRLVETLRATAVLHNYLRGPVPERAQASLMLALAYSHLPVDELYALRDLYLEEVILEFPGSDEAKSALALYIEHKHEIHGMPLPEQVAGRIDELKQIADEDGEATSEDAQ